MTCANAREIILSADPDALRNRTDPLLREHVESCSECAAAASHVIGDVTRLRAALIARGSRAIVRPRRSKTKRVVMTLVPVALAAELAAFAFIGNRDNPNVLLDRPSRIDDTVTSLLPTPHIIDSGEVIVARKSPRAVSAKHVATAKDSALDAMDSTKRATAPSEYVSAEEMAQLQVVPTSRAQRLTVIGTSNPKFTVVWLSRVDSL